MKQSQASRTAEFMALFRALESARPPARRLFADPFALNFLSPGLRLVVRLAGLPLGETVIPWLIDRQWPGARPAGIARTRFIDEQLLQALQGGIKQIVILGAGFDCRPYRLPGVVAAQVYEVDHPATLAVKRRQLLRRLSALPGHVEYLEIDFNRQSLEDVLARSNFDFAQRSLFIWEGVTNYLTSQAVAATLRSVSRAAAGSLLIFTYVHRGVIDNPTEFKGTRNLMRLLRQTGERWTFGLYPAELAVYLEACGFELIDDMGSVECRTRYLKPAGRHLTGYEFYRLALAKVASPGVTLERI